MGQSPERSVILVSRAPVMKRGLVTKCFDETPVYVDDVVRMTGAVIAESHEFLDELLADTTDDELIDPIVDEFINQTAGGAGGAGNTPDERCQSRRSRKARGHSGRKKLMIPSMSGLHL